MKLIITFILSSFCLASIGQEPDFADWQKEAETNKRLLPKYGGLEKSKKEKKSDEEFIAQIMEKFDTKEDASNDMIDLGFQYLYRGDLRTAMYRFNQAYLLDNNNSNIYWGYGAVYMTFGEYDLARAQYQEGLKFNPDNDDILIDYGTTYLGEYYDMVYLDEANAAGKA